LHVAYAEEFRDEGTGGEGLEVVEVFADAEEEDWGVGGGDAAEEKEKGR
jgi:phenylpyruvate tautomerase PptA (4-oxalocrotonate tautomerase family)